MTRMISRGGTNNVLCRMKANRIDRTRMTCIRPEREDRHVISWIKTPDTRCIICWCCCKYISVVSIWTPTNIPNNISKRKIYLKIKLMNCFLLKRWRDFVVTNQKAICLEWGFNPKTTVAINFPVLIHPWFLDCLTGVSATTLTSRLSCITAESCFTTCYILV